VNLLAHVGAAEAVVPGMGERGQGWIVQTISSAALITGPSGMGYTLTKHGALGGWAFPGPTPSQGRGVVPAQGYRLRPLARRHQPPPPTPAWRGCSLAELIALPGRRYRNMSICSAARAESASFR
jgi:hypothetical protein